MLNMNQVLHQLTLQLILWERRLGISEVLVIKRGMIRSAIKNAVYLITMDHTPSLIKNERTIIILLENGHINIGIPTMTCSFSLPFPRFFNYG